jgi:hypothetical protein
MLVAEGETRVSQHAAAKLRSRAISLLDVLAGAEKGVVVEEYEDAFKGPTVLALQADRDGQPLHVLWALATNTHGTRGAGDGLPAGPRWLDRRRQDAEARMSRRQATELIREGRYAAEVTIELEDSDDSWSPTMSVDDALRLERVTHALRRGDIAEAAKDAKVFELLPLAG